MRQPTLFCQNHGRVYKCGSVAPNANKSYRIPLLRFLCGDDANDSKSSSKSGRPSFSEAAWKRRILRGQISVDGRLVLDYNYPLSPGCQISYHRLPWMEPVIHYRCYHLKRPLPPQQDDATNAKQANPTIECHNHNHNNNNNIKDDDDDDGDDDDDDDDDDNPHVLRVIYQDEHMMAVHKPSGLPTMPSQTYFEYSVLNVLRNERPSSSSRCCSSNSSPDNSMTSFLAPPQPVHRLGVGTSGVLLIATSYEARKKLSTSIRDGSTVKKIYRALVHAGTGVDTIPDTMRIDCPIGPVPFPIGGGTIHAACPPSGGVPSRWNNDEPNDKEVEIPTMGNTDKTGTATSCKSNAAGKRCAKNALSIVKVVRRNVHDDTAVVEVEICTGRPHQIRIHMAYAGFPLVGDPLYLKGGLPNYEKGLFPHRSKVDEDMDSVNDEEGHNSDDENNNTDDERDATSEGIMRVALPRDCGYTLHAYQITIEHPTRIGERITFTAKPPKVLL